MFNLKYFLYLAAIIGNSFNFSSCFLASNISNQNLTLTADTEDIADQKHLNQWNDLSSNKLEQAKDWSNNEDASNLTDNPLFDIRVDTLPKKCQFYKTPSDCAEATACTKRSGYYYIQLKPFQNSTILVECDAQTDGGSWTVIQRRQDGSVDFFLKWNDYKKGFGDIDGEFFIGLDNLYALTNFYGPQELLILMENDTQIKIASAYAKYDSFAISSEEEKFTLKRIGKYSGTAGDSLQPHVGMKFATKDEDHNDCAKRFLGAWWYKFCHYSNLNGHYGDNDFGKGINWKTWTGYYVSLKYVKMMIRRITY